ncbi:MAG TPA: type II toxin-antitoxin system RelE/ParE family toxin [Lachnospiraceae bacterium]|nr:type II toxin-antitoxin system RelE/ParE family toxin [Lachnospiraceae bacterium]HAV28217.1 type II toxin-antitoxin system RelE/ParE family toxin [Lachnospiraceae bacterium]
MKKFEVEFYETETGRQPAKEFLLSLDKKMRAKMLHMISILQDNGNELREPYSKHLSDGIFELRAKVGSDITRVLYFFYVDRQIILTNGFIKKTMKTHPKEIVLAKKYRADYLLRRENEHERKI